MRMGKTSFYNKARTDDSQISWKDIFSDSFKKHTKAEMEYALSAGTEFNTATEETMLQRWQKPWLWFRVLVCGVILCALLYLAFLIPQALSAGSAYTALILINVMIPPFVSALVVMTLIWELNIPRNISIYSMLGYFILGGAFSIAFSQLFGIAGIPCGTAPQAPLTEEPGKCIAVAVFLVLALRSKKKIYGLTGLLIGAGVGGGFTAFESIQYAFNTPNVEEAIALSIRRSIPLFGGHILFCAPYAAGLALGYCRTGTWQKAFLSKDFLLPFVCSCFGHFIWNYNCTYIGSEILEWVIAAGLWLELLYMTRKCLGQAVRAGRYTPSTPSVPPAVQQALPNQAVLTISCVQGPLLGKTWRFSGGEFIMGREAGCTIQTPVNAQGVSRRHCRICRIASGWIVQDLNASYGTYLTGGRLSPGEQRPLYSGEIIYLGSTQNAFRIQID